MTAQPPLPSATYSHGPFQQLVGYDILHGENGLYFRLPIRRDHLTPHGVLHGGVPLTLLDAVGDRTLIDRPIPGSGQLIQSSVTVTLTVDFMRAIGAGIMFASATPDHIGKTLAYVSVKVTLTPSMFPQRSRAFAGVLNTHRFVKVGLPWFTVTQAAARVWRCVCLPSGCASCLTSRWAPSTTHKAT